MGLSVRAYARQCGVSHVAVLRAAKAGRIRLAVGSAGDRAVALVADAAARADDCGNQCGPYIGKVTMLATELAAPNVSSIAGLCPLPKTQLHLLWWASAMGEAHYGGAGVPSD
jgi:hypothetical protein